MRNAEAVILAKSRGMRFYHNYVSIHSDTHSSAASGAAAAAAAAAPSPGGGCSAGTAFEDLAGVDVGDTLFVGEPLEIERERERHALLATRHSSRGEMVACDSSGSSGRLTLVGDLKQRERFVSGFLHRNRKSSDGDKCA